MPKLNLQSVERYGVNNMRGERIKNVGIPINSNDAMTFGLPTYTTTLRDALAVKTQGMLIYNTTTNKLNFYNGSSWNEITST